MLATIPVFSCWPVPFFASAHCNPDSEDLLRISPLGVAALAVDEVAVEAAIMTILGGMERNVRRVVENWWWWVVAPGCCRPDAWPRRTAATTTINEAEVMQKFMVTVLRLIAVCGLWVGVGMRMEERIGGRRKSERWGSEMISHESLLLSLQPHYPCILLLWCLGLWIHAFHWSFCPFSLFEAPLFSSKRLVSAALGMVLILLS